MDTNKNKGMYIETIVNNSIKFYCLNKIALFRKQGLQIKVISVNDDNVVGKLASKCDVDYYGIYKGRFIAIETKQTKNNFFDVRNILDHQIDFLTNIINYGGLSYLIIYFQNSNTVYFIDYQKFYFSFIKSTTAKKRIYEV
ncbi:Holliday junction resolvase RecU [bacterium]|nr:Holliday junction resolvase RecU [bacterium]MBR2652226.1 Holliday junction resolvase RecU [bacterium]